MTLEEAVDRIAALEAELATAKAQVQQEKIANRWAYIQAAIEDSTPADQGAEAARVLDMHKLAKRLAPLYRKNRGEIAALCDETLDPSGALLGFVRDAALRAIGEASHE